MGMCNNVIYSNNITYMIHPPTHYIIIFKRIIYKSFKYYKLLKQHFDD